MQFWIAANGRSGTKWLAETLNHSPSHVVKHEEASKCESPLTPAYYRPFPLWRWISPNYGECHGLLRRSLTPYDTTLPSKIEKRYVLLRPKRQIIRSWMNRDYHVRSDLPWICRECCLAERQLLDYAEADRYCGVLLLEELTTDLGRLQDLIDELTLEFRATQRMQLERRNANLTSGWDWDAESDAIYRRISATSGHRAGI